jgi:hypothetical protein
LLPLKFAFEPAIGEYSAPRPSKKSFVIAKLYPAVTVPAKLFELLTLDEIGRLATGEPLFVMLMFP